MVSLRWFCLGALLILSSLSVCTRAVGGARDGSARE